MATKKKTKAVETKVEAKAEPKVETKVEAPKEEVKVRTYDELVILPREEYLKVEADIRS